MTEPAITTVNLQPGAAWTFVHADGRRVEYVYDHQIAPGYQDPKSGFGLSPMHALANPATGKFAQVTEKWLRDKPIASGVSRSGFHSHWVVGEPAAAEVAA